MLVCEKEQIADKYEVMATSRNEGTKKLVEKIGFFSYGTVNNLMYSISGYNSPLSYVVGTNRTYRLTYKTIEKLPIHEFKKSFQRQIQNAYIMNKQLYKFVVDDLMANKKILPLFSN